MRQEAKSGCVSDTEQKATIFCLRSNFTASCPAAAPAGRKSPYVLWPETPRCRDWSTSPVLLYLCRSLLSCNRLLWKAGRPVILPPFCLPPKLPAWPVSSTQAAHIGACSHHPALSVSGGLDMHCSATAALLANMSWMNCEGDARWSERGNPQHCLLQIASLLHLPSNIPGVIYQLKHQQHRPAVTPGSTAAWLGTGSCCLSLPDLTAEHFLCLHEKQTPHI